MAHQLVYRINSTLSRRVRGAMWKSEMTDVQTQRLRVINTASCGFYEYNRELNKLTDLPNISQAHSTAFLH